MTPQEVIEVHDQMVREYHKELLEAVDLWCRYFVGLVLLAVLIALLAKMSAAEEKALDSGGWLQANPTRVR